MGKMLEKLENKTATADKLAEEVIKNTKLIPEIIEGLSSAKPQVKYGCAKILREVSRAKPESLYPRMDFFVELLDSDATIIKWNAIDIVANLTNVDKDNEFDRLFKKFYSFLHEGNLIAASHVVSNSGTIAQAKPELEDKITQELLKVEKVPLPTTECTSILVGHTIVAFQDYLDSIKDKEAVVAFVERQLNNSRNATKKKAEKFLAKLKT